MSLKASYKVLGVQPAQVSLLLYGLSPHVTPQPSNIGTFKDDCVFDPAPHAFFSRVSSIKGFERPCWTGRAITLIYVVIHDFTVAPRIDWACFGKHWPNGRTWLRMSRSNRLLSQKSDRHRNCVQSSKSAVSQKTCNENVEKAGALSNTISVLRRIYSCGASCIEICQRKCS